MSGIWLPDVRFSSHYLGTYCSGLLLFIEGVSTSLVVASRETKLLYTVGDTFLSRIHNSSITGRTGSCYKCISTACGDTAVRLGLPRNCELLFNKLEKGPDGGGNIQHVEVQERGEPKKWNRFHVTVGVWGAGTLLYVFAEGLRT